MITRLSFGVVLSQAELDGTELLLVMVVVALVLLAAYVANARLQAIAARLADTRRTRRPEAALQLLVWLAAALGSAVFVVLVTPGLVPLLAMAALLAGALASVDALRSLMAGLILAVRRPFRRGDLVVIGQVTGLVRRVGLLTVELETDDQSVVEVPTRAALTESVRHPTAAARRGVPVSLIYPLPAGVDPRRAQRAGMAAAILTRYAAPRRAPTVVLMPPDAQGASWRLHIQGAAFDPAHTATWQSDVTDLLRDTLKG